MIAVQPLNHFSIRNCVVQKILELIQEFGAVTITSLVLLRRTALHLEPVVNGKIPKLKKLYFVI